MRFSNKMFTEEEKFKLVEAGWKPEEIEFVEGSIVEAHIRELIKGG